MDNGQKVVYYTDELNDEFSEAKITPRKIDEKYKYEHNFIWEIFSYIIQNFLSMPIKLIYQKSKFKLKYIGKEKIKPFNKQGYFIYVNHTQSFADTFIPSVGVYPKRNFLIVNPANVSMIDNGKLVEMLGAIPTPDNKTAMKNFLNIIKKRIKNKSSITIYPEAHIWPYYTKIRNFKSVSFKYPVELNTPTFCMTNTYQARGRKKNKIGIVTYIDGPFYPDENLKSPKEKQENLRNKVYNKMVERSKNSNIEYIKYIKSEKVKIEK
jgi:1-acyl-sn-glycerol-3-phosphate acyltransferase